MSEGKCIMHSTELHWLLQVIRHGGGGQVESEIPRGHNILQFMTSFVQVKFIILHRFNPACKQKNLTFFFSTDFFRVLSQHFLTLLVPFSCPTSKISYELLNDLF